MNPTNIEDRARAMGLRDWAAGMYTLSAAAELLIHCGPPLLTGPWVEYDDQRDRYWFNTSAIDEHAGVLSGGEQRLLNVAASLAEDDRQVSLGDAVAGLDRHHVDLVLAAVAHAAGSHEHSRMVYDGLVEGTDAPRPVGFEKLDSLHPWPEGESR